jgi:hypothetical protein
VIKISFDRDLAVGISTAMKLNHVCFKLLKFSSSLTSIIVFPLHIFFEYFPFSFISESLSETSEEEGIEKQITSESQGVAIDLLQLNSSERSEEVRVEFDAFEQDEKFEIEDFGIEPETSDMDWKTLSMGLEICSDTIIQREVLQSCLMWGGLGLTKPPKDEDWENAKKIYLMDNELSDLPKNPRCPCALDIVPSKKL